MKEMIIAYMPLIIMALLSALQFYFNKTAKEDILEKTARFAIEKVAEHFSKLDNTVKFDLAVNMTYGMLPKWIKWFIKKKDLANFVQKTYDLMKNYLKNKDKAIAEAAKGAALDLSMENTKILIESKHNYNPDIVSNKTVIETHEKAPEKFDEIWGKVNYKTNFKSEKELLSELGFKKYF